MSTASVVSLAPETSSEEHVEISETVQTTTTTTEVRDFSDQPAVSFITPELALPLPPTLSVEDGEILKLEVVIISHPEAETVWLKNGNILVTTADVIVGKEKVQQNPLADRHFLVISQPNVENSGEYVCRAKNSEGEVSSHCAVKVAEKPQGMSE